MRLQPFFPFCLAEFDFMQVPDQSGHDHEHDHQTDHTGKDGSHPGGINHVITPFRAYYTMFQITIGLIFGTQGDKINERLRKDSGKGGTADVEKMPSIRQGSFIRKQTVSLYACEPPEMEREPSEGYHHG